MLRPSSVRSRIGTRISSRKRCGPVISTPARASSSAGSNSSAHGSLPCCSCASARPGHEPGHGDRRVPDVEHLRRRVAEIDQHLVHGALRARRNGEEAVEQRRLSAGVAEEQKAAACRSRQRPFGDERCQGGSDDGVDGIPSARQSPRTRLGGVTVPGCHGSAHARSVETARPRPARGAVSGAGARGRRQVTQVPRCSGSAWISGHCDSGDVSVDMAAPLLRAVSRTRVESSLQALVRGTPLKQRRRVPRIRVRPRCEITWRNDT